MSCSGGEIESPAEYLCHVTSFFVSHVKGGHVTGGAPCVTCQNAVGGGTRGQRPCKMP
jgi:hypothetical protein